MNLAIFDVDGTLTQTNEVDGACFERALEGALGLSGFPTDWSLYEHVTDSGIAEEAFRLCRGRGLTPSEMEAARRLFLELLAAEWKREPAAFAATPGAATALCRLATETAWRVAVATGCWRESAVLKLRLAGFPLEGELAGLPLASADDRVPRVEIMEHALALAAGAHRPPAGRPGEPPFARVVYLGDALWDVRACAALGLPFVGVGREERAERLREAGASHVLPDFTDYGRLRQYLEEAAVPAPAG
jgi:phosphoglycolate phosphatase-like HAD superfamily hydrolase